MRCDKARMIAFVPSSAPTETLSLSPLFFRNLSCLFGRSRQEYRLFFWPAPALTRAFGGSLLAGRVSGLDQSRSLPVAVPGLVLSRGNEGKR